MPDGFTGSGAIVAASFDFVSRSPDSAAVASLASPNPEPPFLERPGFDLDE